MRTRAAILVKSNKPLVIDDVEIPVLKKGQVLVKIFYSGVCRAQYNEIIALKGPDKFLPHLLGHEASALVVDCGQGITKVRVGDTVCLSWIKGKGLDGINSQYRLNGRIINAGGVTTFSDYAVVSENRVTKVPANIDRKSAAIVGCAVLTGGGLVKQICALVPVKTIVIFGVGGVGLNAVMVAKTLGIKRIVAVDISKSKLSMAIKFGATDGIPFSKNVKRQLEALELAGFDAAIDASGHRQAMELGFEVIKASGVCLIAGNLGINERIAIHPFELIKGKRIFGSWGGGSDPDRDIPRYLKLMRDNKMPVAQLITHSYPLERINQAFETLISAQAGRIVVEMAP